MASDMVAASILIFEECQQAAMLAAGEDKDGISALFPSMLLGQSVALKRAVISKD